MFKKKLFLPVAILIYLGLIALAVGAFSYQNTMYSKLLYAQNHKAAVPKITAKKEKAEIDPEQGELQKLMDETFNFSSLNQFVKNYNYGKARIQGSFYDYWFKAPVENNVKTLQSIGKDVKRKGTVEISKSPDHTYFVVVKTYLYTSLGSKDNTKPSFLGLVAKKENNVWQITKLSHFDSLVNNTPTSDADNQNYNQ